MILTTVKSATKTDALNKLSMLWGDTWKRVLASTACVAASKLTADDSNVDGEPAIEQRFCKPSSLKNFLTPDSCRPWAPAVGRWQVPFWLNERPRYCRSTTGSNARYLAINLNFCISGYSIFKSAAQNLRRFHLTGSSR